MFLFVLQYHVDEMKKSFLFSALYAAFVFGGRHLMNKRAKFELRKPLVLWSLTLAVFRSSFSNTKQDPHAPVLLLKQLSILFHLYSHQLFP
ncbi:hypothetical protein FD755_019958 [Muntiacus reevesi]|uniref:very-long-chain 3-oxoacyl-CoA synthase n=1 Tax=Muntiacus reevesi TaxID=9886 RepID=A0A5N3X3F8_MUNRE|nr:hypothetical protein FD755_019958 [Muntiacus reevesi]